MMKLERHNFILKEVRIHNKVLQSDLSQKLDVSIDTIRRDLHELSILGKLIKVRGGAMANSYHSYNYIQENIFALKEKQIIARKAVNLIREGMIVCITGGTTNHELVSILPKELSVTFFTNSLEVAMALSDHPNSEVIIIGGKISKDSKISVGPEVFETLDRIKPDLFFLGTSGIDTKVGLTSSDWEVANIKRNMILASSKTVAVCISQKINSRQSYKIAEVDKIDYLITELNPDDAKLKPYVSRGIIVY